METEIWKDIQGYEGHYQVSNLGRIKNIKMLTYRGKYLIDPHRNNKILIPMLVSRGYFAVSLYLKAKHRHFLVHRLIALAFIQNPNNYPQVNHINGIKTDNRIGNLEWCTAQQNCSHAWKTGLSKAIIGETNKLARLCDEDVITMRKDFDARIYTKTELATKYKIHHSYVCSIINKTVWKHI